VLDTGTGSLTDWVLTQPLKNAFVSTATAFAPYTNVLTASGACETIGFSFFNREEQGAVAGGIDFSPLPTAGAPNSICWESTVLSLRNDAAHMPTDTSISGVLGSRNTTSIHVTGTFQNGWASLEFVGANSSQVSGVGLTSDVTSDWASVGSDVAAITPAGPAAVQMFGLPVTGFMVRTFSNGTLTCGSGACQGNYASLFDHAYRNVILP
jgi:hypothetical protein